MRIKLPWERDSVENESSRRPGGKRRYRYHPRKQRIRQITQYAAVAVLSAGLIFGVVKLVSAGVDALSSRRTSEELQSLYESPIPKDTVEAAMTEVMPIAEPQETGRVVVFLTQEEKQEEQDNDVPPITPLPESLLPVSYSENSALQVRTKFQNLQAENEDIIGWLTIEDMVNEAVVQRDNVFYLDHDAKGRKNTNGALFLDAAIPMKSRPYSLVIYGHNMRTGEKFGKLRRYEDVTYYHRNPFLTFDTEYEDGKYVIFSSGTISMREGEENYLNFFLFTSSRTSERQRLIDTLIASSTFSCEIDVSPQDQLLALVTCVGDDNERRIVAARRIREDETESQLTEAVMKSRSK